VITRRDFLATTGRAALALTLPPLQRTKNYVWMRPNLKKTSDELRRDFALIKSSGLTGVIAEIYNGRTAFYASKRFPVRANWLEAALPIARAEGLELHAWMWTMICGQDAIVRDHPDWYNVNAKGESAHDKPAYVDYYKFLDPARPEVRAFVRETVTELAAIPGLASVHLDYVRHPDAILPSGLWSKYGIVQDKVYPPYDYGYTAYSRKLFKATHGIDPIELKNPESNRDWLQYRLDSVVDLVNDYLVPAAHAKGTPITAAVFPGPSEARRMVRQDWGRFNLDAFFPMLYSSFYEAGPEFVGKFTGEAVRTVKAPVYSGLYVDPLSAADLTRSIDLARSAGAAGVSIFDLGAMTPERWRVVQQSMSAR
jgi:uncharacterized lipoprotein YddW (UPF0748 family)